MREWKSCRATCTTVPLWAERLREPMESIVYKPTCHMIQPGRYSRVNSKQEGKVLLCKHPFSKASRNPLLNGCNPGAYGYTPRISVASATRATANRYDPMRRFVSCSSAFTRE